MSALKDLERDVHQFLSTLANVRRVDVEASAARGKKRVRVSTYVNQDSPENRERVRATEETLKDRHRTVKFDFTTRNEHESRTVGTA